MKDGERKGERQRQRGRKTETVRGEERGRETEIGRGGEGSE